MNLLIRTARVAGALYLALIVLDIVSVMIFYAPLHRRDFDAVVGLESIVATVLVAVAQALTGVWLYRLFRPAVPRGANGIALSGLVSATLTLVHATRSLLDPVTVVPALPFERSLGGDILWISGEVCAAVWLILIGRCVVRSGLMPRLLGLLLIAGGAVSVVDTILFALEAGLPVVEDVTTGLIIVGEIWLVGYLLIRGVRHSAPETAEVSGR